VVEFVWHHSVARPRKPPILRKDLGDISYVSRVIACFAPIFVAMIVFSRMWGGAKTPGRIDPYFFLVVDIRDVITWFKFGDDRFRGLASAEGQILLFPIDFGGCPCKHQSGSRLPIIPIRVT